MPKFVEVSYIEMKAKMDAYIDSHAMRHTVEREMLLGYLCEIPQPFVAQQLVKYAVENHVSPASVYNFLSLLLSAHIIHCVNNSSTRAWAEYEWVRGTSIRMQLVCSRCGRIADFNDVAVANILKVRKFSNFNMSRFSIYVYGECKTCKRPPMVLKSPRLLK